MTTTTTAVHRSPQMGQPGRATTPMAPRLPRRRWGLAGAGIAIVAVAILLAVLYLQATSSTRPYLAVRRHLAYGSVITGADLTVLHLAAAGGLAALPDSQRAAVVGKYAATDLFPGTPLSADHLTDQPLPRPGEQLVGLELKPAQLPARAVRPGEAVLLVVLPDPRLLPAVQPGQPAPTAPPTTVAATVATVAAPADDGDVRVDVAVAASHGPTVAAMAAAGRLVLVVTTRTPR